MQRIAPGGSFTRLRCRYKSFPARAACTRQPLIRRASRRIRCMSLPRSRRSAILVLGHSTRSGCLLEASPSTLPAEPIQHWPQPPPGTMERLLQCFLRCALDRGEQRASPDHRDQCDALTNIQNSRLMITALERPLHARKSVGAEVNRFFGTAQGGPVCGKKCKPRFRQQ